MYERTVDIYLFISIILYIRFCVATSLFMFLREKHLKNWKSQEKHQCIKASPRAWLPAPLLIYNANYCSLFSNNVCLVFLIKWIFISLMFAFFHISSNVMLILIL
uniref:Uncharacterized protein n=1 Tax=Micrurus lemniscatus lemniscatus TaxID=129467 RepID=A0A2D4H5U1_MICLE